MDGRIMDRPDVTVETVRWLGWLALYGLLGVVGTAVVALPLLVATQPVQAVVYRLFYGQLGPSEATDVAVLTHVLVAGLVGISLPMLVGDYLSDRLANRDAFGAAVALLGALLLAFLVASLAHLAAVLTALVVLAVAAVAVPVVLRYGYGVRSGGVPAFVGGIPVLVVLLLVTGFGLGWGWGYYVTATAVTGEDVTPTMDFEEVPRIRTDLFEGSECSTDGAGRETCRLQLRGYEHEGRAARFLARHGVHCPYQNAVAGDAGGSAVASYDGSLYRVRCVPHGD